VLTHMGHRFEYHQLRGRLPTGVEPGYDGMTLEMSEPHVRLERFQVEQEPVEKR